MVCAHRGAALAAGGASCVERWRACWCGSHRRAVCLRAACCGWFALIQLQEAPDAASVWRATAIFIASDKTCNGIQLIQLLDATKVAYVALVLWRAFRRH